MVDQPQVEWEMQLLRGDLTALTSEVQGAKIAADVETAVHAAQCFNFTVLLQS